MSPVFIDYALSDLFFNCEQPERDALFAKCRITRETPSRDQQRVAAVADATAFLSMIRPLNIEASIGVTPEDLADDFLNRV